MRPTFGREYIENKFQRIGDGLSEPLAVYLINGGAMSLRNLKGATKDATWSSRKLFQRNCSVVVGSYLSGGEIG